MKHIGLLVLLFLASLSYADGDPFCADLLLSKKLFNHAPQNSTPGLSGARSTTERLFVQGGQTLSGVVRVSPAKNAYLPILAATLLNPNPVRLIDMPELRDMETFLQIFRGLGVKVQADGHDVILDASSIHTNVATCELVKTMRASILVLGPLLARFQGALVGLPGGCPIGSRPINIHLDFMRLLGAKIEEQAEFVLGEVEGHLQGAELNLPFPSVGATQNLIMAATLAQGTTIIRNAAREPEIDDLVQFLNVMGAKVETDGQGTIRIEGVTALKPGVSYRAIGDRIEAATYVIGALMTDSELRVEGFVPEHIAPVLDVLRRMGAKLEVGSDYVKVLKSGRLKAVDITTEPHPGYPTDVQAQLMMLMTQAEGVSTIRETIFESRFLHVAEMQKMGADITVDGNVATIRGPTPLHGAQLSCTDLRGGIAILLGAITGEGPSELSQIYWMDRGYSRFLEKFHRMGACQIERR